MNKIGFKYGMSLLWAWLFVSCQQEGLTDVGQGYITVSLVEETTGEETKATPAQLESEIEGLFHLTIRNASGFAVYDDAFTDGSIRVAAGTYTVSATFGTNQPLALDAPYYTGESAQIQVTAGGTQSTEVTCRLANALISIDWTNRSKFDAIYSNYGVQVQVGTSTVKMTPSDGKSAYLQPGTAYSLQFVGTRISDQTAVAIPLTSTALPTTLTAKEHCKLTLSPDTQTGLKIQKAVITQTTIQETIPLEWLPAAEIKAVGFENNLLSFYETETPAAQLEFTLASALQDMAFELDFGDYLDENGQSLNGSYRLSQLTEQQKQQLVNAGFFLPQIGAQGAAYLTFTNLLPKLKSSAAGPVNYTIKLTSVLANGREACTEPQVYTITVNRPVLTITLPDYTIWTKQFTISECQLSGGNEQTIRANLKYQYRLEGNEEWIDCTNTNMQVFNEQPAQRNFQVRAVYKEIASNIVSGILEEEAQVPNANMDEWTDAKRDVQVTLGKVHQQPIYYPWNDQVEHWWDTNNNYSMLQEITAAYIDYKCFPTTCYVSDGKGGKAAQTRSVATNAWNSEISSEGKKHGILYAGGTDYDGNMTEGRIFSSRPTKLIFNCMYDSYDNERFGVYVELLHGDDIIAFGSLESIKGQSISSFTIQEIPFIYTDETVKATKIKISFYSVAKTDSPAVRSLNVTIPDGEHTIYSGSVLTIDDISLIYDK
ncbi:MAG: DUF4493 domain-containing protein [Parabacteroides sp.]